MLKRLFASTMAKAVGGLVASLVISGAVVALAAPNTSGQPLSTNGSGDDVNEAATATATSTATPTPTGTATSTTTPSANTHADASETAETDSFFGLCNAWSHGSDKGQANKHKAAGFQDLVNAASASGLKDPDAIDTAVVAYCQTVAKPTETTNASPGASPAATSASGTPTPGNENSGHGNGRGNSGGHSQGHSGS